MIFFEESAGKLCLVYLKKNYFSFMFIEADIMTFGQTAVYVCWPCLEKIEEEGDKNLVYTLHTFSSTAHVIVD